MKAIKVTQELKDKNKLFEKREAGFIHVGIPKVFHGAENIVGGYDSRTDLHDVDGWKTPITPAYDSATQRLGELYADANGAITYRVITKTPEDLAAEAEQKKQIEREKIKEAKVKAYVESQLTVAEKVIWFPEWVQRAYAIDEKVSYKGKPFNNTVAGNTNAPDKGGWTEIK